MAVILHLLPDLAMGGGQQVVLRHARALERARFETHVAHFGFEREMAPLFARAGIPVHQLPYPNLAAAPAVLRRLLCLARRIDAALLHTHGTPADRIFGQLAALRLRLPLVTTLHGLRPKIVRPKLRPRALLRWVQRGASTALERILDQRTLRGVVAVSDAVRDDWTPYLASRGPGEGKVFTVYSGIPLEDYARPPQKRLDALAREVLPPGAGPVLVAVSRLHPSKRNQMLVPILERIRARWPRAVLLLAGEGEERAALLEAAAPLGDALRLLGTRADVPALLHLADLVLFPSNREGFGLAVLEALAAGRPVVATDLPQFRLLIAQGAGLALVADDSPQGFADAALALLEAPNRAAESARKNLDTIKRNWDIQLSARRYEQLYAEILSNGTPRTGRAGRR